MKLKVESPLNRICISHNRKGHSTFVVFLLSFFAGIWDKSDFGVRCRSPPFNLDFNNFQNSDWRKLEWHIITDRKNTNGVFGKKSKKEFYENAMLTRIPSRSIYDRADFNATRRFYCYLNNVGKLRNRTENLKGISCLVKADIEMQNDKTANMSEFVEKIRSYTEIKELTPFIINEFNYIMV